MDPEDAFDMLTATHKTTFRPAYGDLDYLTMESFEGFEITRQVKDAKLQFCIKFLKISVK